jgi:site-specific DNA-methyltransferase (adenine-specific)
MSESTRKQKPTKTSSFGTPGRISHDSGEFYSSRLYENIPGETEKSYNENPVPLDYLDCLMSCLMQVFT